MPSRYVACWCLRKGARAGDGLPAGEMICVRARRTKLRTESGMLMRLR